MIAQIVRVLGSGDAQSPRNRRAHPCGDSRKGARTGALFYLSNFKRLRSSRRLCQFGPSILRCHRVRHRWPGAPLHRVDLPSLWQHRSIECLCPWVRRTLSASDEGNPSVAHAAPCRAKCGKGNRDIGAVAGDDNQLFPTGNEIVTPSEPTMTTGWSAGEHEGRGAIMDRVAYDLLQHRIKNRLGRQAPSVWVGVACTALGIAGSALFVVLEFPTKLGSIPAGAKGNIEILGIAALAVFVMTMGFHFSRKHSIKQMAEEMCEEMDVMAHIQRPPKPERGSRLQRFFKWWGERRALIKPQSLAGRSADAPLPDPSSVASEPNR